MKSAKITKAITFVLDFLKYMWHLVSAPSFTWLVSQVLWFRETSDLTSKKLFYNVKYFLEVGAKASLKVATKVSIKNKSLSKIDNFEANILKTKTGVVRQKKDFLIVLQHSNPFLLHVFWTWVHTFYWK